MLLYVTSPERPEMPGRIRIRLKPGAGGGSGQFAALHDGLKADLEGLRGTGGVREGPEHWIAYDPSVGENTIEVSFGGAGKTYTGKLEDLVRRTVLDKDEKLTAKWRGPAVVALDLRAFGAGFPPEGSRFATDPYYQDQLARRRTKEHREALVTGLHAALRDATSVRAVVTWWRRWGLSPAEELFRPWEITWTTRDTHVTVIESGLQGALFGDLL